MIKKLAERLPGDSPTLDAQMLLEHVSGQERTWWMSHPEAELSPGQAEALEQAVAALQAGTPMPYVLGHWGFFGLDFIVTPDVLIPRPETELLVETGLAYLRARPQAEARVLDVGTGPGTIAVSLAVHAPGAAITALDISPAALEVAQRNAARHGVEERIRFIQSDLLEGDLLHAKFDLVCANLPYIPSDTLRGLEVYDREPSLALDGGPQGLDLIGRLLAQLGEMRLAECLVLLEIEARQGVAVSDLAHLRFPLAEVRVLRDLAGFDRLVMIET